MDRSMMLTSFYFGIFCTLFYSTYTISVYNPRNIFKAIIKLTENLEKEIPEKMTHPILDTPVMHNWEDPFQCLVTYLNTFDNGIERVSEVINGTGIIKRIQKCIQTFKQDCKIMSQTDEECLEPRKRGVNIFVKNFLDFSKFLYKFDFTNKCNETVLYEEDYYVNDIYDVC
ncbi:hypothetical protein GDO81_010675 [Engystomops pustulosus]|uniref:Uncharacterized protein n=1 Tax=Engystomops pustulosus TaxID=76066 RepID=A0AAV7C2U7_ENGPU|nr:hypothetical protein GDO81_010675 [Engystomops pustulosus]